MGKQAVNAIPGQRIEAFTKGRSATVRDIAGVVEEAIIRLKTDLASKDEDFLAELEILSEYVREAKAGFDSVYPGDVSSELIPSATNELDAIVEATEKATHEIMDAIEIVEDVAVSLDNAQSEKLQEAATRIYQACGFQDITGQRTTKVVKAMKKIEERVDALIVAFGGDPATSTVNGFAEPANNNEQGLSDEDLLEGPQLPGQSINQDEVDALLASFD